MFQLMKNTQFDFMGRMNLALTVSGVLLLASVVTLAVNGLNLGIEFTGGTELQIKYREAPDIAGIRSTLNTLGVTNNSVTSIGAPEGHEVYIKLGNAINAEDEDDPTTLVIESLRGGADASADLNVIDRKTLAAILLSAPEMTSSAADDLAGAVLTERKNIAIFDSVQDLAALPGATPEILQYLDDNTTTGAMAVRSQSYIFPAIGAELKQKAGLAILGSLVGMLIYIWIRFRIQWGFAAVAALAHDTILTLGLFSVSGKELSLPVVAAFLTLVGYSVNDTVVVFDRIRENQRKNAGSTFEAMINLSLNQTLSRTVITSGLTLLVVLALLFFGGAALNPFSFVLAVGVVVGTYSSIYVASPILVLWERYRGKKSSASAGGKGVRATAG